MARVYTVIVVIGAAVAFCEACTSSSGRTPSWDISDNAEVYPTYDPDSGAVGVEVEIRFRREVESRQKVFDMIDVTHDGFIDVCEWTKEGGTTKNFVEFLRDDDNDGDEKISRQEFPNVKN